MKTTKTLAEIESGKLFEVAGIEFIKFADQNGQTVAVAKDVLFNSEFGKNNNFAASDVKYKLEKKILSKLEKAIGAENIIEHEVDLLSLDGDDKWGKIKCKISIPTFDFYRANVKIFDKYKPDQWWWLATPDTTSAHYNDNWIRCVASAGFICNYNYDYCFGVRPFLIFNSSISVSCEE